MHKGFTLIELLVVVVIISVLLAIGFSVYGSAQKNSRDNQRAKEMKSIQQVFEQYYSTNGTYPTDYNVLSTYFLDKKLPDDPINAGRGVISYIYTVNVDATSGNGYCACAKMENTSNGNARTWPANTNFTFDTCPFIIGPTPPNALCVKNIQ